MRDVRPHGFTDSDLYKIVLGAALRINPFRKPKAAEIRRLCIESHDRLGEIRNLFASSVARDDSSASTEVLGTLEEQIKKAEKPWCWMLDHDPEEVVRAFTLAALLHQHGIEYQVLLGNFDPALGRFQDISQKSIEQTLKEMLQADPDRIAADVAAVERFLKDDVEKRLAFFLSNRCQVEQPERAKGRPARRDALAARAGHGAGLAAGRPVPGEERRLPRRGAERPGRGGTDQSPTSCPWRLADPPNSGPPWSPRTGGPSSSSRWPRCCGTGLTS